MLIALKQISKSFLLTCCNNVTVDLINNKDSFYIDKIKHLLFECVWQISNILLHNII